MKSLRLAEQSALQTAEADAHDGPSKTEVAMSERLASLEPGSKRRVTLEVALDFKRSWVRLAKQLAEIRAGKLYREWGYRTFEAYGKHELHLKKETISKLVRSYEFLNQHERQTLEQVEKTEDDEPQAPPAELPSFQALDILAEARQNPNLPEEDYRELRDQVFRDDPPPSTLRKLVKEKAPEPVKPKPDEPGKNLRKALGMAERLYGLLLEEQVPDSVQRTAEDLVGGLRRLIED